MPDTDERRPEPDTLRKEEVDCDVAGAKLAPPKALEPCSDICCVSGEGDEGLKETLGRGCVEAGGPIVPAADAAKPLVVRVEMDRPVKLLEKAADVLRGTLVPVSGMSNEAAEGDTGGLGRLLERPLIDRSRLSLVLGLRTELGTMKAGSALRAAAKAGLEGTPDELVGPMSDKLLLVEPVLLRLERPAEWRPGALVLNTLGLAGDCDVSASAPVAPSGELLCAMRTAGLAAEMPPMRC